MGLRGQQRRRLAESHRLCISAPQSPRALPSSARSGNKRRGSGGPTGNDSPTASVRPCDEQRPSVRCVGQLTAEPDSKSPSGRPDGRPVRARVPALTPMEAAMTAAQQAPTPSPLGPLARYERNLIDRIADFNDPHQEWRRLFSELLGTFFLVLAVAGGGILAALFLRAGHQCLGEVREQLPGRRLLRRSRVLDGAHLDRGPGQRDPGHRVGRPERRHHRSRSGSAATSPWPACGAAPSPAPR
jgi:hypothetical protein